MILRMTFAAIVGLAHISTASAQEVWSCTYPELQAGLIAQYRKSGNVLIETLDQGSLRIIRDDEDALIAINLPKIRSVHPNNPFISIGMIAINKRTNNTIWVSANVDEGVWLNTRGSCIKN